MDKLNPPLVSDFDLTSFSVSASLVSEPGGSSLGSQVKPVTREGRDGNARKATIPEAVDFVKTRLNATQVVSNKVSNIQSQSGLSVQADFEEKFLSKRKVNRLKQRMNEAKKSHDFHFVFSKPYMNKNARVSGKVATLSHKMDYIEPTNRAEREEQQRQAALRKQIEERKSVPKREREQAVLRNRDKRNGVEFQRGVFLGAPADTQPPSDDLMLAADAMSLSIDEGEMPPEVLDGITRHGIVTMLQALNIGLNEMIQVANFAEFKEEMAYGIKCHRSCKMNPRSHKLTYPERGNCWKWPCSHDPYARLYSHEIPDAVISVCRELGVVPVRDWGKSHPFFHTMAEWQSGRVLPILATAAGTLLITRLTKFIKRNSSRVVDSVRSLVDQVRDIADKFKKAVGKILWTIPLIMILFYAISQVDNKHLSNPAVALLISAFAVVVGPKLWAVVSGFFPDGKPQLQTGLGDASSLLASLFTFSVFKNKKVSPSVITEFCKRVSMFDRMSSGFEAFIKWVMSAIEGLVNFARVRFGKEKVDLYKRNNDPLKKWARAIDDVAKGETLAETIGPERLDHMVDLIRTGYGYKELYRGTLMSRDVDAYLIKITNLMTPYLGTLNARNNFRFEPAAMMLLGAPGVGKTLLAMPLCAAVMLESGLLPPGSDFDAVAKNVWQKGTSEFWNSYSNQLCLVMDDAFQQRADATDKENEYITMIRMVGSWSFPLNFADLSSKGKMFFGSKFIFGTTNLASINAEAKLVLQEPEAVTRRINFPYRIVVKPEFAKEGKLDYAKYVKELALAKQNGRGMDAFPWHVWNCYKHNFLTGTSEPTAVPLREVVGRVAMDLRERVDSHAVTKTSLEDFVAGFVQPAIEEQAGGAFGSDIEPDESWEHVSPIANRLVTDAPYMGDGMSGASSCDYHFDCNYDRFSRDADEFVQINYKTHFTLKDMFIIYAKGFLIGIAINLIVAFAWGFLTSMLGFLFKGKKKKEEAEVMEHEVVHQSNRPLYTKHLKPKANSPTFQSVDSAVATKVYCNSYKVFIKMKTKEWILGQVLFLSGSLAAQPHHFTRSVREYVNNGECDLDSVMVMRSTVNNRHQIEMPVRRYLELKRLVHEDRDVEFVDFGVMQAHQNIVKNFVKESDVKYLKGCRARLDVCEVDDRKRIVATNKRSVHVVPSLRYGEKLSVARRFVDRYFEYTAATVQGDCGAPLCVFDNSTFSGRSVIGVHVAGNPAFGIGYSNIMTQEMIEDAMRQLDTIYDDIEADLARRGVVAQAGYTLPFEEHGSFLPLFEVEKPVVICPKTSYYLTNHYGALGEYDHRPAHLRCVWRDDVCIFPMENAVRSYSSPVRIYTQPWLKQAVYTAMRPLSEMTRDSSRRDLTFEEAVLGMPERKFRSIPRGTAAGFPYVYDVREGKKEFFGSDEAYRLDLPKCDELRERVDFILEEAKKGRRLAHIFIDFLKDELRSKAKVDAVATRLISSAPLDFTIAWRMKFGDFSAAVMEIHTLSGMAPGICCYTEWDKLVAMLKRHGPECFDGDFKFFDASEQPSIHWLLLDFINAWYNDGEESARVRKVLWMELVHSRHIGGLGQDQRYIYQWNKSLPSGHPFTTIVNSMYSLVLLVSAYIKLTGDLTGYWSNVSSVTYGDDNNNNVSPAVSTVYNQATVAKTLAEEFDVIYTAADKSGELRTTFPLEQTSFLKRGFVCRDNVWLCPLELESFLYTIYWCKNRKLEKKILDDCLETTLEELSLHSQLVWDYYAPLIERVCHMRGYVSKAAIDQSQYFNIVRSRADNWY